MDLLALPIAVAITALAYVLMYIQVTRGKDWPDKLCLVAEVTWRASCWALGFESLVIFVAVALGATISPWAALYVIVGTALALLAGHCVYLMVAKRAAARCLASLDHHSAVAVGQGS